MQLDLEKGMMDRLYAKCKACNCATFCSHDLTTDLSHPFNVLSTLIPCYEVTPCITDCIMAELEKLGQKYRVALRCVILMLLPYCVV